MTDLDRSLKFYTGLLGMKVKGRTKLDETGGEVVSLVSEEGGPELELNYYPKGNRYAAEYTVGEGLDHLAFRVGDLDSALVEFAKAGHPMVLEVKSEKSRWVYVEDPDGNYVELMA